jgi:citrate lyase subunit beta/citryl-CoA lyase
MAARSYLYVPGDQEERLAKAETRGADALILDLEDGVAPAAKERARATVRAWLSEHAADRLQVWIRVNNTPDSLAGDLSVAGHGPVTGVILPKATLEAVEAAHALLEDDAEGAGPAQISPLIESAQGIIDATAMARHRRVSHLGVGLADLQADLGIEPSEAGNEWAPLLMQVVVASAAASITPPTGPTWTAYRDLDGLRASSETLRRLGFRARTAIHPAQIPVIHEVFTPTPEEVARARRTVDLFEEAVAAGRGIAVDDGRMIDEAVVRSARRILAFAPSEDD